jgi:DNA-binding response OmpR family regulator
MQKILLIEDQPDIQIIVKTLLGQHYQLIAVATAEDACKAIGLHSMDLVLLDVSLPDDDGFQLFTRLKRAPELREVPIIFLTGKKGINDRVAGFSLGADDYIVKPFEPLEFRARIEAKMNARLLRTQGGERICKGRLELNPAMLKAFTTLDTGSLRDLGLTPHEFHLLIHFMTHEGHVLSRDQLMTVVWGDGVHVLERTIDRHVSSLRRKLDPKHEMIEAVHGVGYKFVILTMPSSLRAIA